MAQVTKKTKKDGTTSYLIRAYSGRTQTGKVITKCKTVTPPAGLTARKTERWVQEQADQFERERSATVCCWTAKCCWMT